MVHRSPRRRPAGRFCAALAACLCAAATATAGVPRLACDLGGADVPFEVSEGAAAVRVWARKVSAEGRPGAWATVATVDPGAGGVRFVPPATGAYDLCVRALDAAGEPVPPGPLAAGLRVVCGPTAVPAALQLPGGPGTSPEPSVGGGPAGGPSANQFSRRGRPVPPAAGFGPNAEFARTDAAGAPAPLPAPLPTSLPDALDPPADPGPPDAPLPRTYEELPSSIPGDIPRGAPAAAGEVDEFRAQALLGAARNAVARGELGEAARRFEEYLLERPGDTAVRAEAAGVLVTAGRTAEAAAAFETLIAADPRDPAALAGYADLLIGLGNYATARENLLAVLAITAPPAESRYLTEDPERAEQRWDAAVALVRSYLLEGSPAEAQHAAAAHLAAGPPPGAEPRLKYARLLMELGRPGDALALLDALRREFPQDPRPVADLLLAHVRLLDAPRAGDAAAALASMPVSDAGLWLGLGEALYRDDALREARRVLGQLISAHPDHDDAAVLLARTQSRLLEFSSARAAFEGLEPKLAGEPRFEAAYTEYLILAGEWADAVARAKVRLRDRPADAAALRDLGDALHASGQYLRAEGQYAKVVALLPEAPEPTFLRAKNLAFRRNFDLAINMLDALRARRPADVRVTLQLAATLVKRGTPADLARAQAELTRPPAAPRTPRQEAALRIKLAEVLTDRRRPSEALRELERLPAMAAREPAAVYLTSRALAALGRFDAAENLLHASGSPLSPIAGDAYTLLTVAGLATEDCECCLAQELAGRVAQFAPDHPLALNLRAEAMLLCRPTGGLAPNCGTGNCCGGGCGGECPDGGVFCGLFDALEPATSEGCGEPVCGGKCGVCPPPPAPRGPCRDCVDGAPCGGVGGCGSGCGGGKVEHRGAAGVFAQTLMHRPRNSRAQLGYARGVAAMLKYWDANVAYQRYLAGLPEDINVARERARLVDAWKGYAAADYIYAKAAAGVNPDGAVAAIMQASFAEPAAVFGEPGSDGSGLGGPGFGGVSPAGFGGGAGGGSVVPALGEEYEALSQLAEIASTEQLAKQLRTHRPRASGPLYRGLIALEPGNQDARFDLAQTLQIRGLTRAAEREYRELLAVNPCHSQARVALERHRLWRRPAAFGSFSYLNLEGRDGLADLEIADFTVGGRLTTGDTTDTITASFTHRVLEPSARDGFRERIHGEVGSLRFARRLRGDLSGWAQINIEEYDEQGFDTRPTFDAGLAWVTPREATVRAFGFLQNVALNRGSLLQDIHRAGVQADVNWLPTRRWQLDAFYRVSDYSDDNLAHEAGFHNGFVLRPGRRQLRLRTDVDMSFFRNFTVRDPLTGVLDATHPYFSPDSFVFGTLGLEWKHWLSCDTFLGANAVWYELYAAARFDSDSEAYALATAAVNYDLTNQLTFTADAGLIRSEIYDETRARAYLEWRFR